MVILHLLTRGGLATRADLARTLGGYDEVGAEHWDRVLMDNPKRWLVGKHQVVIYDKDNQTFLLPFDLSDEQAVAEAQRICETAILTWLQRRTADGSLDDAEILRHYRVLELAKHGDRYHLPNPDGEAQDIAIDEFAMAAATTYLHQCYPTEKVIQQPYTTPGFDILVGTAQAPVIYGKVKGTLKPMSSFTLSEGERQFAIDHSNQYQLMMVYAIDLNQETCEIKVHQGAIKPSSFLLSLL
ncbi:DUF3883 domain-containing protein [Leptolyngbya sp. CCY15150]|uniref:protein NO VEIN domain-containing protein n=1 Tax=Leptolyngbya sp. CCY15150 TaxID=2767772 RepID=UPI001952880E